MTDGINDFARSRFSLKYMANYGHILLNQPKQGRHTWVDIRPTELRTKDSRALTEARCLAERNMMVRGQKPDEIYAGYVAAQRLFNRQIPSSSQQQVTPTPVTKSNIGLVGILILTEDPVKKQVVFTIENTFILSQDPSEFYPNPKDRMQTSQENIAAQATEAVDSMLARLEGLPQADLLALLADRDGSIHDPIP